MKEKPKKKISKKAKIVIAIVAILLLAIVVATLVIIQKENRKNQKKDPEQGNIEETDIAMPDYYSIISYLKLSNLPTKYLGYFYQKEQNLQADIDNQVKIYMAIRKVIADHKDQYTNPEKTIELSEKEIEKALVSLFGSKVEYKHESLEGNSCSFSNFQYDSSKKLYIQKPGDCLENGTDTILAEIKEVNQGEKKIEVYEVFSYVELSYDLESQKLTYNIYKDLQKQEKIASVEDYSIESIKDQLNTYKYTFIQEGKTYYLTSVELVK